MTAVTHRKAFDPFAHGFDHAGNLPAGREGALRLELVEVTDHQRIGEIDRAGLHRDQHLAAWRMVRDRAPAVVVPGHYAPFSIP